MATHPLTPEEIEFIEAIRQAPEEGEAMLLGIIDKLLPRYVPTGEQLESAIHQFSGRLCSDCPIPEIMMAAELDAATGEQK